ncbi:MAG: peptidoglycan DD-metalloendopeptidase family protein [Rhodospirillaceae bacterium]|jgi:murein DD-endopeptidase MepM/ murein hydrolase activator NlpD|nr:peptidoglycan DD-metalloendopeptidase family protein [Rhodospirillaceae bacterium]MBT4219377.1 peptidoglycan DD-metalloendopeptidase family protein [Rhodospirillaceae bacterium]MBT5012830.1 peptidoglycan DD-metalloendopeptidase family protein [Rhodospirillaceae bacterium]MBT5309642.1 peptidoglycan DD-metalloendopeptidase family protein [Rhodospirillaceae bacterium]MBT6405999.1 peptidoglycan DD-metalloendopeptidase family protein [Rhodospirillaceae bacterium]
MHGMNDRETFLGRLGARIDRLFPERQIVLRSEASVSFVTLSKKLQVTVASLLFGVGVWTTFASVNYALNGVILEAKDQQVAAARLAYRSLLTEVDAYQKKFSSATKRLEANHGTMLGLVEQNASLQLNLKTVTSQLRSTEQERENVLATREELRNKLANLEGEKRQLSGSNSELNENLKSVEKDLQVALSERNGALFEGTRMRRQIKELDNRLVNLEETETEAVQRLTNRTTEFNENIRQVVKMTGLNYKKLLAANGMGENGQGGPFIPAKPDGIAASKIKVNLNDLDQHLMQAEGLQEIMAKLPFAPPLTSYRVTSRYGKRRDPVNKKWSSHYGLDMGSPFNSGVYVAAPGVVTFAGWKGRFGKMIEIDHGAGLKTRFAHLNKILVKKGQKVGFRDKVGLLGSTGRSTGAHLHYEISFKGRNLNPLKFFKAGRYVFKK